MVVPKALAGESGRRTLFINEAQSGLSTLNPVWKRALEGGAGGRFSPSTFDARVEVETTTLDALAGIYGRPRYLKLDIEGSEAEALSGLTVPAAFVSFEANLPELQDATLESLDRLVELSRNVAFAFAERDGMVDGLIGWLSHSEMSRWIRKTDRRFLEILACSDPNGRVAVDAWVKSPA